MSWFGRIFGGGFRRKVAGSPGVMLELRQQLFSFDPMTLGISQSEWNPVWSFVMETGLTGGGVYTLVAIADDTVSLYFSNGGGFIGAGTQPSVQKTSRALLEAAPAFLSSTEPTTSFPPPTQGRVRFYFLAWDEVFTAEADEQELGGLHSPLSPLFFLAQDVITEIRLIDQDRKAKGASRVHPSVEAVVRCASTGDESMAAKFIEAGADPDGADITGLTPLMAAAYMGHIVLLSRLLAAEASVTAEDTSGYTALIFACNAGQTDCAQLLLEHGSDPHSRDKQGSTPLMFAAQHGHNAVVRLLLAAGADPRVKGKHGLSAIGFAKQNKLAETLRILEGKQ